MQEKDSKCWKCDKAGKGCCWIESEVLPYGARKENGIVVQCREYKQIVSNGKARRILIDEDEPKTMARAVALFYGVVKETVYRWKSKEPERYEEAVKTVKSYWGSYG